MQKTPATSLFLWLISAFLLLLSSQKAMSEGVTVFAASSLREAVEDVARSFEEKTRSEVTLVFAATSAVARQVAQGAPADVVLLADQDWANWLLDAGAVDRVTAFAGNTLVLIGRSDRAVEPAQLPDALGNGVLAMAQVDAVPAGRYGKAALEASGVWDSVMDRTVQASNVRAALRFVERGDAAFGIGYASDVVALPTLAIAHRFAPDTHAPIVYGAAPVTDAGAAFVDHLMSPDAQQILAQWGFAPRSADD